MSDTAQDYQKLISDALQKQMVILGRQITLLKARNVPGLSVSDDGRSVTISGEPQQVITQFLGQFRELSSPLVKKTMQPLLSIALPTLPQATALPPAPASESKPNEPMHVDHPAEAKPEQHHETPHEVQERKEEGQETQHKPTS
jgi:hypothetical protein